MLNKYSLNIKPIFSTVLFFAAALNSITLFAQDSPSCSQENIIVSSYELRKSDGTPFTVTDQYEIGEVVNGELWVTLGGSTANGYNLFMSYDIWIEGQPYLTGQWDCLFVHQQIQLGVPVKVRDFTWTWGDQIQIKNVFMYWITGNVPNNPGPCGPPTKSNQNAQCYFNANGFSVTLPLNPRFDFQPNTNCTNTVEFTSTTIGGTEPYAYDFFWDFDGDAIIDSYDSITSYSFPSSGTYPVSLIVDDGTSINTITKEVVVTSNIEIQASVYPDLNYESTGSIYVQNVSGGTAPYTYLWTFPDGSTTTQRDISNLEEGTYRLVVTDANNCSNQVDFLVEAASVLSLGIGYYDAQLSVDQKEINLTWITNKEIEKGCFEVQRKESSDQEFKTIGSVAITDFKSDATTYHFTDKNLPFFGQYIYYRLKKVTEGAIYFSTVKLVQREITPGTGSLWEVYPNPSFSGNSYLKLKKPVLFEDRKILLRIYNSERTLASSLVDLTSSGKILLSEHFSVFPKGLFYLEVIYGNSSEVIKLINK